MFIKIVNEFGNEILINLSYIKSIVGAKNLRVIQYCLARTDGDKYFDELFETIEEANKRYIEICKLLEIK